MVKYYGLHFGFRSKKEAEDYFAIEKKRKAAEQRGEPWEVGNGFEYLGFDDGVTIKGPWKGDIEHLAVLWWIFTEGGPNGYLEDYFDRDGKKIDEPVTEEENEDLCYKYTKFLGFMKGVRRISQFLLEKLENNYDLELHMKPDIIKNKISLDCVYNDKYFNIVDFRHILDTKKYDENFILNYLDESLVSEEQEDIRSYRAKTALRNLHSSLKQEIPVEKHKMLNHYLRNGEKEIPKSLKGKVIVYRSLKSNLEKILSIEKKLIKSEKNDLANFDKAVESLFAAAKNPSGRYLFDDSFIKTMSDCYGITYTKPSKPKTDVLLA